MECFAAAQRIVEAADPARIGAGDDDEVGVAARGKGFRELFEHELGRHQVIDAGMMLEAARQELVFDLDGREAGRLGQRDGAMHVHRIAKTAAGVEHDRQLAHRAHVDGDLRQFGHGDVGFGDAFVPAQRATAEIDRLEAGSLGEPRHDRIERHRCDDQLVARNQLSQ